MPQYEPTTEELHQIRQLLIRDSISHYKPSIQIMKAGGVPNERIEEVLKSRLQCDLRPSRYFAEDLENTDRRILKETGVAVNTLEIYRGLIEDYLLLLQSGGIPAILRALEEDTPVPRDGHTRT